MRARGVGVVYISHRLEEVFVLADRVTVLRDGAYVGTREVANTSTDELITMMVGRTIDNLFPKLDAEIGGPVLEVRDLCGEPLFRDVSLELRAGEIVGLAGLVGAGRSELAQAIFGDQAGDVGHDPARRPGGLDRQPERRPSATASRTCRRTAPPRG